MEFSGRGELSERQQKLGQHLGHLVRLAEEFNIAIVVVSFASCLIVQVKYVKKCNSMLIHLHWHGLCYDFIIFVLFVICPLIQINQCMADPGALSMFGPVIKPVGGHVLAHASTTRVMLKKGKGEQRIAKIFDRYE